MHGLCLRFLYKNFQRVSWTKKSLEEETTFPHCNHLHNGFATQYRSVNEGLAFGTPHVFSLSYEEMRIKKSDREIMNKLQYHSFNDIFYIKRSFKRDPLFFKIYDIKRYGVSHLIFVSSVFWWVGISEYTVTVISHMTMHLNVKYPYFHFPCSKKRIPFLRAAKYVLNDS